ncbi:SDR family NAD(P)-dependent oxidoreductase, partial [Bradyrhizobium sp. NBAIM08]|nr:SDR family NAD(P)-dependent oxidoreductase [Bradyrhizobium sp. NBAIM08]
MITGCSTGIGRAIAVAALDAGNQVVVTARRPEAVKDLVDSYGERALAVALDVTDRAQIEAAVAAAHAAFGGLDVLVNNAGICHHRPALEVPDEEWREVFEVNVHGLWLASKEAAAHMAGAGGGTIVNIGSISAQIVNRPQWQPAYNASKAAVHQLTRSLAAEWAPLGIRV